MTNVIKLIISISVLLFSTTQSQVHRVEKYRCTSSTFEEYLISEYSKYDAEICFIDVQEEGNKGTVIVLDYYDHVFNSVGVWGKLDIKKCNVFLSGRNNNCDLFEKINKQARVKKYKEKLDANGYIYELDDGIMTSVLYNGEGLFEMDWVNQSLNRIGDHQ